MRPGLVKLLGGDPAPNVSLCAIDVPVACLQSVFGKGVAKEERGEEVFGLEVGAVVDDYPLCAQRHRRREREREREKAESQGHWASTSGRETRQSLRQEGSHVAALLRFSRYTLAALRAALWHF